MRIEEAIRHYEESEKINKELAENCVSAMAKNHNLENAEKCRQMIEWLTELQERRKQPQIIYCGECKHKKDHHYENPGEEPYIKSTCENKYGLVKNYQVHDWDFCSRAEKRHVENG